MKLLMESVDKALRLLHMFREKPRWTVSEVSEALGVARITEVGEQLEIELEHAEVDTLGIDEPESECKFQ